MTLWFYASSELVFRRAVEAEAQALAEQMGARTEEVVRELSDRLRHMRERPAEAAGSAFAKARQEALAAAEQLELRELLRTILSGPDRRQGAIPFAFDASKEIYTPDP